jgi:hypothetical protein
VASSIAWMWRTSQQISADAAMSGISVLGAFGTESIMADENWFPHTSQQIVSALRMGGYASFIPSVIEPVWDGEAPPLAGFPISICFTGLPMAPDQDAGSYIVASYWFDPQSYDDNAAYQAMIYRSRYLKSGYQVALRRFKRDRSWEGCKMRGDEVVVTASDPDVTRFVVKLTMQGLDNGEHVEPMLTRTDTASTGIWVYDPAVAEVAHTGRLQ